VLQELVHGGGGGGGGGDTHTLVQPTLASHASETPWVTVSTRNRYVDEADFVKEMVVLEGPFKPDEPQGPGLLV